MRKPEGLCGLTAMLLLSGAAHAQVATDATQKPAATSDTGPALDEIVVTAQKRSENLQNVPIAITAITAQSLTRSGVSTTQNLVFAVPSLVYSRTAAYAQPFLRGIGSELNLPNADPSVTTYVDGVVVSTTAGLIQDLLGVDRVEVSEGPQGTLNGRNATAGAISIYTLTPTQATAAEFTGGYGNYNQKKFTGFISGGLSDTLSVGLYGGFSDRDTYLRQLGNAPSPSSERDYGGRIKAVWTPVPDVKLTGSVEYTKSRSLEAGVFRNIQSPNLGSTLGAANATQPPYTINTGPNNLSGSSQVNNTTLSATLREEVDFGWARLLGISGYRKLESIQGNDDDATPIAILGIVSLPARSKQFSQEAQLISPDGSKFKWIAGLYYLHERAGFDPLGILSDVIFPAPFNGQFEKTFVNLNSYAAFGQGTLPLVDKLNLTVGGRYTVDKKVWNANSYLTTGPAYTPFPGTATTYPTASKTFKNFTPKVTLDYKLADRSLVYATFARGYKAGAFNIASPAFPMPPAVNPEKLDDYEVGIKTQLFDNRLRINGSGYYYNYSNIQTSIIGGGSSGVTTLENANGAKLYGIEGSVDAALTSELRMGANLAWEHTKFNNIPNISSFILSATGNVPTSFDVTGNATPRAPKWVGSARVEYDHKLTGGGTISLAANMLYNGGFFWEATDRLRQGKYAVVNANAGFTFPGDHLTISAFVTNLTNKYYATSELYLTTEIGVVDAPPRMYGVTAKWKL